MKLYLSPLFLALSFSTFALADNIPTTSRDANFRTDTTDARPELRQAIAQLNADVAAWNARCAATNSDAAQSWCERERAALEARKVAIKNGVAPSTSKSRVSPPVDVYLRYATRGKILKHVTTDSTGLFDLGTFPAGVYIMEFRARKTTGIESQRFAIRIDGIKAKGRQEGMLAKYLIGGFGVDVETAAGMPISGQVTTGSLAPSKRMVWISSEIGSGVRGHWVEEGSSRQVAGSNSYILRTETIRKIQDHGDQ